MAFFNKTILQERASKILARRNFSNRTANESVLLEEAFNVYGIFDQGKTYDIFLSHSYTDRKSILGLADALEKDYGYSVYIDWIDDPQLDRTKVNRETAERLRMRMVNCRCLFYATTSNAQYSKWMPWETGVMDGLKGRVAICPMMEESATSFNGQEYLQIYPYVDYSEKSLWINDGPGVYKSFREWVD